MSLPIPQPGSAGIPAAFLEEVARNAGRPLMGPGVTQTHFASCVLGSPPSEDRQEVGLFELAGDLTKGGQAEAYPINWNGTAYATDKTHGTATVYDVLNCFTGKTGDWGYAWQGPDSENNQVLYISSSSLTPYILYDDCAPGDTSKYAWPVKVTAGAWEADTAADKVYLDNTFDGTYRGLGTNHTGFTPSPTAKVWTAPGPGANPVIVCGVGQSKRCSAALTADAGPGASVTVDTVVPLDGGQNPVANSTSATIASCTMPWAARALDNAPCEIEWDEDADAWKITRVHEQAMTISASATVDGSKNLTGITSPAAMDGGQVPSGTLTIETMGFQTDSGSTGTLIWNEATDKYRAVDFPCPT